MTISRRNFIIIVAVLLGLLVYFVWPGGDWDRRNFPPTASGPWVAFGDSLTEGYGASPGGDYPSQLSKLIGVPIENAGVSGETSGDGLKRLERIEALNPRVVLLCFGGNDVLRNLPQERMFANIGSMIDRLHAQGSFVVLIGVRGRGMMGDGNADGFVELAREKGAMHIPNILDGLLTTPSLMSDYVHPNDAGYAKIADRLAEELKPLLPKLAAQ